MKLIGRYNIEGFYGEFEVWGDRSDYGVPGSPVWYEPDFSTLEVIELEILEEPVEFDQLPEVLKERVLELAKDLDEWIPAE